jgi:hypothetical protein
MPLFCFTLEDDIAVWTTSELECTDENIACEVAVQLLSKLFVQMRRDGPDWSNCRVRVAEAAGQEIMVTSAAQVALEERDRFRAEALVRTDQ